MVLASKIIIIILIVVVVLVRHFENAGRRHARVFLLHPGTQGTCPV